MRRSGGLLIQQRGRRRYDGPIRRARTCSVEPEPNDIPPRAVKGVTLPTHTRIVGDRRHDQDADPLSAFLGAESPGDQPRQLSVKIGVGPMPLMPMPIRGQFMWSIVLLRINQTILENPYSKTSASFR